MDKHGISPCYLEQLSRDYDVIGGNPDSKRTYCRFSQIRFFSIMKPSA